MYCGPLNYTQLNRARSTTVKQIYKLSVVLKFPGIAISMTNSSDVVHHTPALPSWQKGPWRPWKVRRIENRAWESFNLCWEDHVSSLVKSRLWASEAEVKKKKKPFVQIAGCFSFLSLLTIFMTIVELVKMHPFTCFKQNKYKCFSRHLYYPKMKNLTCQKENKT